MIPVQGLPQRRHGHRRVDVPDARLELGGVLEDVRVLHLAVVDQPRIRARVDHDVAAVQVAVNHTEPRAGVAIGPRVALAVLDELVLQSAQRRERRLSARERGGLLLRA